MIRMRLSSAFLARMRFAYSPLAETAKSLYMVNSGVIHPLHRGWYERVRSDLGQVDREVLSAVVPPGGHVAEFLFVGATATTTTIEQQLQLVADWPLEHFVSELVQAWRGVVGLSAAARRLIDLGADGPPRVADALEQYWRVAVAPYWPQLRAVLDADVAYRVGKLAQGGIAEVMQDLHPSIELTENAIRIASAAEGDVDGGSLTLVPCVFIWPHLWVELGLAGEPSLTYGARGVGALWQDGDGAAEEEVALGALLGRSRAEILVSLALPRSTTDLARSLGLTPPTVSSHLAILRRGGLVTCWRSGRRVLYRRTRVGSTIVAACGDHDAGSEDPPTPAAGVSHEAK
jgi:DNA-binding transcriptional ArsR family regulator